VIACCLSVLLVGDAYIGSVNEIPAQFRWVKAPTSNDRLQDEPAVHWPPVKDRSWRAPCKGGVSQWVQIPPGDVAPAGSNRSSHGGNEVAEAPGVEGH
jgi:hypothetical protein